jgi:hypothetical protein
VYQALGKTSAGRYLSVFFIVKRITMCYLSLHVIWTIKKGGNMVMHKRRDTIPEHFNSAEEAGEFWDTHSAVDYWSEMAEEEMEFDIAKRTFWCPWTLGFTCLQRKKQNRNTGQLSN